MSIFKKIIEWNRTRGLLDLEFNHTKQVSFITEELLESTGNYNSINAREKAEEIAVDITKSSNPNHETMIDAFADIIVFATGAMGSLGYDPDKVMDEVYKEINSRTGTLVDGKFVKDLHAERYCADLTGCKLEN